MTIFHDSSNVKWRDSTNVKWTPQVIDLTLSSTVTSLTSLVDTDIIVDLQLVSDVLSTTPAVDFFLSDNIEWLTLGSSVSSSTSLTDIAAVLDMPLVSTISSSTPAVDFAVTDNVIWVTLNSSSASDTSVASTTSDIQHPVDVNVGTFTADVDYILTEWIPYGDYDTFDPINILICSGSHGSIEHMDPTNDTSTTIATTCSIRTGGYGVGDNTYSWLMGGYESLSVERIDNTNYTNAISIRADLPIMQAGGASLYGNPYSYLAGNAWSSLVQRIDVSTETVTNINDLPIRTKENGGRADSASAWVLGGVDTQGYIETRGQKLTIATHTWTLLTSLNLIGGTSKHSAHQRGTKIWYAGGTKNNGMTVTVNHMDLKFDVGNSIYRSDLSAPRNYPGSINNALYGWIFGGYNLGDLDLVDRVDLVNDSVEVAYRCTLNNSRKDSLVVGEISVVTNYFEENSCLSMCVGAYQFEHQIKSIIPYGIGYGNITIADKVYIAGGQNYTSIYNYIYLVDLTNDSSYTLVNSSLTSRYSLFGLRDTSYSWFTGGRDSGGNELDITEKLDHSSDTTDVVTTAVLPAVSSNGGCFSISTHGYTKAGNSLYKLDFSNDTWSTGTGTGTDLFISGSGIEEQGIFAGGITGATQSNSIDSLTTATDTWITDKYNLSTARHGISGSSVTETSWFIGGTLLSQVSTIESVVHLSDICTVQYRGELSTTRSRSSSFSNNEYTWVFGGYRISAVNDVDRFDPYTDTTNSTSRTTLTNPVHSAGIGSPVSTGLRTSDIRRFFLSVSTYSDINVSLKGMIDSDTLNGIIPSPYDEIHDELTVDVPHLPLEYTNSIGCITISGDPYDDTIDSMLVVGIYGDKAAWCYSLDPYTSVPLRTLPRNTTVQPYVYPDDVVWVGGGLHIQKYEKIDSANMTPEVRGETYFTRMGGAAGTSSEKSWIGGGSTSQNIVELFTYATDTITTGDRSNLSNARSYLSASNDSRYCWYWGGIDNYGVVGTLDRLDKANDTSDALLRKDDLPRCRFNLEFSYSIAYGLGGQVGASDKDWTRYFDPSNDTIVNSSTSLISPMSDYSSATNRDSIYIFLHKDVDYFDPSTHIYTTIRSDLPGYTQSDAHVLGDTILLTGGTTWTEENGAGAAQARSGVYDPVTDIFTDHNLLNYDRHNHWSQGYSSNANIAASNRNSIAEYMGTEASEINISTVSTSADDQLNACYISGVRYTYDIPMVLYQTSACTYMDTFESSYNVDSSNNLWRFQYNCDAPIFIESLNYHNSRFTSMSTGQQGWMAGGSSKSILSLSYNAETIVDTGLTTDDVCESATHISNTSKGWVLGGVDYEHTFISYLVITDAIRIWDYFNDTWTTLSETLNSVKCRAAGVRGRADTGYIIGGSTTIFHALSDEIEKMDMTTDICTILPSTLIGAVDLHQAVINKDQNIVVSNGDIIDTMTDTPTRYSWDHILYGESFFSQSSNAKMIGGSAERVESPTTPGTISIGNTTNQYQRTYDHITNTWAVCPLPILSVFFESSPMYPYSFCGPLIELNSNLNVILSARGEYATWVSVKVEIPYVYTDSLGYIHESYQTVEDTRTGIYTAFDQSVISGISLGQDTYYTTRNSIIHISVEHWEEDRDGIVPAIDTPISTIDVRVLLEQLSSTTTGFIQFPNFYTVSSDTNCSLLIGGEITTRRCYIPPTYEVNWDLSLVEADLDLLINKELSVGTFNDILSKLVKGTGNQINWEAVLQDVSLKFGDSDFIYALDTQKGVIADEGVLIKTGYNMQIVNFLVRLSGTDMWVSNEEGNKFFLNCYQEYEIDGILNVPIVSNIMILSIKLPEPLTTGVLSFKFESVRSSCHLKLIAM